MRTRRFLCADLMQELPNLIVRVATYPLFQREKGAIRVALVVEHFLQDSLDHRSAQILQLEHLLFVRTLPRLHSPIDQACTHYANDISEYTPACLRHRDSPLDPYTLTIGVPRSRI